MSKPTFNVGDTITPNFDAMSEQKQTLISRLGWSKYVQGNLKVEELNTSWSFAGIWDCPDGVIVDIPGKGARNYPAEIFKHATKVRRT